MSIGDIFWLFFMFHSAAACAAPAPETMRCGARARSRNWRPSGTPASSCSCIGRKTMRFLGFPLVRYIDINDLRGGAPRNTNDGRGKSRSILSYTPRGGIVLAALQIARAIHEHKAKVTVFVPHYAMSGGTLIAPRCRRNHHVQACRARADRSANRTIAGGLAGQGCRTETHRKDPR